MLHRIETKHSLLAGYVRNPEFASAGKDSAEPGRLGDGGREEIVGDIESSCGERELKLVGKFAALARPEEVLGSDERE
jgi:hypothetical protein